MGRFLKTAIGTIVVLAILGVIGGLVVVFGGLYNIAADKDHLKVTKWMLTKTMENSVSKRAREIQVPTLEDPEKIRAGFAHYDEMCVMCHGGPAVRIAEFASGLNPRPPLLTSEATDWSPREIFWITKHGVKMTGMPAFGSTHSDEEIWAITAFVNQLPDTTAEQYQAMRKEAAGHEHEEEEPGPAEQPPTHEEEDITTPTLAPEETTTPTEPGETTTTPAAETTGGT